MSAKGATMHGIIIENHSSMIKDILELQKRIVVLASLAWDTSCEVEVRQEALPEHVNRLDLRATTTSRRPLQLQRSPDLGVRRERVYQS